MTYYLPVSGSLVDVTRMVRVGWVDPELCYCVDEGVTLAMYEMHAGGWVRFLEKLT